MLVRMTDDRWQAEALRGEAVHRVAPLTIVSRATPERFATDLAFVDGRVAVADHGSGPDELTAVLVADQRYLVEEVGHGSILVRRISTRRVNGFGAAPTGGRMCGPDRRA